MSLNVKLFLICKNKTLKILLAASTPETTKRLRWMIQKENKNTMICAAANYETALQLFTEKNPVVVLLDMNCQGKETLELLREIKKTGQQTAIIILSINISKDTIDQCKLLGATIFLDKFLEFEKIPRIISGLAEKLKE